ncbi:MAG: hypothetical protein KDC46_09925 [Thermoleophilia bacterium]|nr:hypothetical protein [Thermoleophilia bacterium]
MTTTPEQFLRDRLHDALDPTAANIERQRTRFRSQAGAPAPRRSTTSRLLPRMPWRPRMRKETFGFATVSIALALTIAAALLPSSGGDDDHRRGSTVTAGLRLVTAPAGGAFKGIDLDSASAAEVLDAAGRSAAAGIPDSAGDWSYSRVVSTGNDKLKASSQHWVSPDGERTFAIIATDVLDDEVGTPGRSVNIHYEYLRAGTIGDVSWGPDSNGHVNRQASWNIAKPGTDDEIQRMVELRDELSGARSANDVRSILRDVYDDPAIEYRGGMACRKPAGPCSSMGYMPMERSMTPAQTERIYGAGQLLSVMSQNVFSAEITRAAYDYLAALPEASTRPSDDDTGDVVLSFTVPGHQYQTRRVEPKDGGRPYYESSIVPGTTHNTKAAALIDSRTGRIVQLNPEPEIGGISYREVEAGLATGPGVGGKLCDEHPDACAELRDLNERLQDDPDAQFTGVLDWMQIQQFCDGLVDRDGKTIPDAGPPLSVRGDASSLAKRDACIEREAAAARAG